MRGVGGLRAAPVSSEVRRRVAWFAPGVQLGSVASGMKRPLEQNGQEDAGGALGAQRRLQGKAKSCITTQVQEHAAKVHGKIFVS